jgi:hypothetical protein
LVKSVRVFMLPPGSVPKQPDHMKKLLFPALALFFFTSSAGFAQMSRAGSPGIFDAALTQLFGNITAFSTTSEVQVLDQDQKEKLSTSMNFAMLDHKVRVEIDMTRMRSTDLPPGAAASMKQMGMDRVVSIVRPDLKAMYVIYPGLQSYAKMPLPPEDAAVMLKDPKLVKTALGKETMDGHPCVKNQVTLSDDKGEKHEATVWNAIDLKDFPVQILTREKSDTVIMRFKQVQCSKPDAQQFDPPAGFKEYPDVQAIAQAAMTKMMGGAGAGKQ